MEGLKALVGTRVGKASKVQDPPQEQQQLLISLYNERQFQKTLDGAAQLLQHFPNSIKLFNVQGASNEGLGRFDAAVESYKNVLAINPDSAVAYYNMGNALKDQGKFEEAIEAYNKAIVLNPDNADAHNNLGIAFKEQGKFEMAMEAYHKALAIKSDYAAAYCNNMSVALQQITFKKPIPGLQNIITLLLDRESHVRASSIAVAVISLLKLEPQLKHHLQNSSVERVGLPLQDLVSDLSRLSLLLKLMSVCPLYDWKSSIEAYSANH